MINGTDYDAEEMGIESVEPEPTPFYAVPYSTGAGALSPVSFLIGIIGLLVIMHFVGNSKKTSIQPAHLEISGYNILGVTASAVVGLVTLKIIFNRWPIPGLTDLINAA